MDRLMGVDMQQLKAGEVNLGVRRRCRQRRAESDRVADLNYGRTV